MFQAVHDTLRPLLADPKYRGLGAAGHPRGAAHLESDAGPASARALFGHGRGSDARGALEGRPPRVSAPGTGRHGGVSGQDARRDPTAWTRGALVVPEGLRPQQGLNLLNRLGHPTKTRWHVRIMERYAHGAGVVTYLARSLRGGPIQNARLVAWDGARVIFTYRARHEEADGARPGRQQMTLPVADFLQRWLLPCARAPDADRAVLWAVPCDADCGAGAVPRGARATAGGGPGGVGLADGVCPAWGGPSRAVSHLWPAARVYRGHPTWRCAPRLVLGGVRRMRSAYTGEACQGRGVPGGGQGTGANSL